MTTRKHSCGVSLKSAFIAGLLILITGQWSQWAEAAPPPPRPESGPDAGEGVAVGGEYLDPLHRADAASSAAG
jgi:hypothetical protein